MWGSKGLVNSRFPEGKVRTGAKGTKCNDCAALRFYVVPYEGGVRGTLCSLIRRGSGNLRFYLGKGSENRRFSEEVF